ncbi:hypothetical protein J5I75_11610, partial [Escherichia coli]
PSHPLSSPVTHCARHRSGSVLSPRCAMSPIPACPVHHILGGSPARPGTPPPSAGSRRYSKISSPARPVW